MVNRRKRVRTPDDSGNGNGDEDWRFSVSPRSTQGERPPSTTRLEPFDPTLPPAAFPSLDELLPPSPTLNRGIGQMEEPLVSSTPYLSSPESSEDEASHSTAMSITKSDNKVCLWRPLNALRLNEGPNRVARCKAVLPNGTIFRHSCNYLSLMSSQVRLGPY